MIAGHEFHFRTLLTASVLALSQAAVAQEAAPAGQQAVDGGLEEIVVTAQKRAESVQDVPISITSITAAQVERLGIVNVWDLSAKTANVSIDTTNGAINPRIFIRGLGTNDFNANSTSAVSIYMDEVPLSNNTLQGFPPFDIERVEVLRGPQGTLWGVNTTGGLVHIVSARPEMELGGYAKLSYGRWNELAAEGAITGPLIDGVLAARLSFMYYDRDGWLKNDYDGSKLEQRNQAAVRAQLLYTPSDNFEALFSLHARTLGGQPKIFQGVGALAGSLDASGTFQPAEGKRANIDQTRTFVDAQQRGGLLNMNWNLAGGATLTSITAYEDGDYENLSDDDGGPRATENYYIKRPDAHQFTQEIRLTSDVGQPLRWIVGGFFLSEKVSRAREVFVNFRTGLFGGGCPLDCAQATTFTQKGKSIAAFGHVDYDATEALTLSAGLRYTRDDKDISLTDVNYTPNTIDPFNPALALPGTTVANKAPVTRSKDWDRLTWEVVGNYKFSDDVSAYAKVAQGFRSGNFNGGAGFGAPVTDVSPEILTSYEAGLRSELMDRKLRFNATGYYYDYKDLQLFSVVTGVGAGATNILTNVGKGKVLGAEIEIEARPVEPLLLSASIGYADTEFTSDFQVDIPGPAPGSINARGNRFPRAPLWSGQVSGEYTIDLGDGATASFYTGWSYKGKVYFNSINFDIPQGRGLTQKGAWMGDVRVGYRPTEKLELTAFIRNVTDKQVVTTAFGPFVGMWGSVYSEPRSFGVAARVGF